MTHSALVALYFCDDSHSQLCDDLTLIITARSTEWECESGAASELRSLGVNPCGRFGAGVELARHGARTG